MQEMKTMINMRFGPDTWQSIVDLRAKRIQEEKERIAEAKRLARQKQKETEEAIKQVAMIGGIIVIAVGLFVFLITIL